MAWITNADLWAGITGFLTLAGLEVVLGIDNIVFLSILTARLPESRQPSARFIGLLLAMLGRIALLFCLSWLIGLTAPLFTIVRAFSGRDMVLLLGGLFLVWKSTHEIHGRLEGEQAASVASSYAAVLLNIFIMDMVFSLDSVITAVGMVRQLPIMVAAIITAVLFMMAFSGVVSRLITSHPTIRMLALAFLLLVGVVLIADGFGHHVDRGYIYFAMGFSLFAEILNIRTGRTGRHRQM